MPKAPKSKKKGNKFYAVRVGRTPGVYQSWDECEMQVRYQLSGVYSTDVQVKQYPGAVHKAFKTEDEATVCNYLCIC
jgi:viroplasmin and RNaseH domain-containing protein